MSNMIGYKALGPGATACHGGTGSWHRPSGERPGKWMPLVKDPVPCERGYHLCRDLRDALRWLGPELWVAEGRGAMVEADDKVCVAQARLLRRVETWNERTARLFAADCAEHVLPIWEQFYPADDRPRRAIEAARAFAAGQITAADLAAARAAAGAARAAAWAAAWSAAWEAERDWQAARLAELLEAET